MALPLGTPRLQQEVCSFHSLNIIQVLTMKASWNSMNRIDYSTLFTAGSSQARPARHAHGTRPPGLSSPASKCGTYTSPILCPLLWVQKARIRAQSSYPSSHPADKLVQCQKNPPVSQEIKTVQKRSKRVSREAWVRALTRHPGDGLGRNTDLEQVLCITAHPKWLSCSG